MEATIYSIKGKEAGKIKVSEDIFGLPWYADLVHQVVSSMQSSSRSPVAHTKTRGEVRGGGKKPWQQKGTGRARHGSTRSPIWVGGGVTHGPRNDKNYERKINKKMKTKALATILSEKYRQGEIFLIDSIDIPSAKTKEAVSSLKSLSNIKGLEKIMVKKVNSVLIGIPKVSNSLNRSFRNIGSVKLNSVRNWNPVELLKYKYALIVDPKESFALFEARIK